MRWANKPIRAAPRLHFPSPTVPLLGSAASLVAKADMQDSAQPGALQDSEASKFEELELQAEE